MSQLYQVERNLLIQPLPWKVGTDLFEWNKATYLLIVDYYSRWIDRNRAECNICYCSHRHGILETVISDNVPQFSSEPYAQFAREYAAARTILRQLGEAERGVQTVKKLLKKRGDPYLAFFGLSVDSIGNGLHPLYEQKVVY